MKCTLLDLKKSLSFLAVRGFPLGVGRGPTDVIRQARQCREQGRDGAGDLIPTRRSLLSRLKNWSDQPAWMTFFDTYWNLIYNAAIRSGLTDAEAQDAVQETLIAVWKKIPEFVYDPAKGSFKAWLLQQAAWRIKGQLRKRLPAEPLHNDVRSDTGTTALERVPDPATSALRAAWDHEWEENLIETALRRVRAKVDPKQYQIFDFAFCRNWPTSRVARTLEISAARVYLVKCRVGRLLKQEVLRLRTKPI